MHLNQNPVSFLTGFPPALQRGLIWSLRIMSKIWKKSWVSWHFPNFICPKSSFWLPYHLYLLCLFWYAMLFISLFYKSILNVWCCGCYCRCLFYNITLMLWMPKYFAFYVPVKVLRSKPSSEYEQFWVYTFFCYHRYGY